MPSPSQSLYDIEVRDIDGNLFTMERYRGRVLLVVNVASRCGHTPQYAALETLYRAHRRAGFVVLGFPCNQFGRQEPGTDAEVRAFCSRVYGVTFPMFSKIDVNGPGAHPLYRILKAQKKGIFGSDRVKWNFTKFLVGRAGAVLRRYAPGKPPAAIEPDVVAALASAA
ncbi:MAG: glutathione peroxidase [Acidobacteria bacterium]|nr:glutathione peroxidase [Acidobacteriota bacterium]